MKPLVKQLAIPLRNQRTVAKWLVIAIRLVKRLANPLSHQRTVAKWLVIGYQKALHSHSAKSPKYSDISRWLTIAKSLVIVVPVRMACANIKP